jgi:hypothetical protein
MFFGINQWWRYLRPWIALPSNSAGMGELSDFYPLSIYPEAVISAQRRKAYLVVFVSIFWLLFAVEREWFLMDAD